ncbi:MAG: hypothetical protein LR015_10540 [Verrucomicrobia bacterium]|nr:hypothetical protein [Verrucomicrobiota bacterium]
MGAKIAGILLIGVVWLDLLLLQFHHLETVFLLNPQCIMCVTVILKYSDFTVLHASQTDIPAGTSVLIASAHDWILVFFPRGANQQLNEEPR